MDARIALLFLMAWLVFCLWYWHPTAGGADE